MTATGWATERQLARLALPIVGSARAVGRLDLAEIRGYVKSHLIARDLVVAACGAVEHEALCALVDGIEYELMQLGTSARASTRRKVEQRVS